jgi:hypothetical protein
MNRNQKESQKRTQRREDAKDTQSCFFCFSLRYLGGFATLRESLFAFSAKILLFRIYARFSDKLKTGGRFAAACIEKRFPTDR